MFIRWLFYSGIYPQWKSCQLLSWLKYPCKSISFRYCLFHDNISTIYISTIIFPTKQYFRSWMNFPERSFKSSECLILQWGELSSFACPRAETSWFNGLNVTVKLQSRGYRARAPLRHCCFNGRIRRWSGVDMCKLQETRAVKADVESPEKR